LINATHMDFKQGGTTLFCAPISVYNSAHLEGITIPNSEAANWASTLPLTASLWHRRCCHHGMADIAKMRTKGLVTGMTITSDEKPDPVCEPCLAGKMHSHPFPSTHHRALKPLELVHSDLHGPLPVRTHEGYRYWITFIDDATSYRAAMMLKRKSDAFDAFRTFKAYAENQLNARIKSLQDEKGGEYMSNAFIKFTTDCGIVRRHTTRNRPRQNGVAERANRTMSDDITAMLTEAQLPASFWGKGLAAQIHVWNQLPTSSLAGMTPHEAWFKQKPDISHFRVWGCQAYVFIQKDKRKSLQPHMESCIFVGYPAGYKGWKFYNPRTKKFTISECAEFDERNFPGLSVKGPSQINLNPSCSTPLPQPLPISIPLDFGEDSDDADSPIQPVSPQASTPSDPPLPPPLQHPPPPPTPIAPSIAPTLDRSTHVSQPPGWWKTPRPDVPPPVIYSDSEDELNMPLQSHPADPPVIWSDNEASDDELAMATANSEPPRTLKAALKTPQANLWHEAATLEYNTLVENNTWEIVELPPGKKAIGSGWVLRVKNNSDGTIEHFKGRIVAKGFSQRPGIDFNEVFAPTFRPATLRLVVAITAIEDMELRSVDITSAFVNGDLDEEIYMKQPEGFHIGGPNMVCRLKKSLYGLKQSACQWNKKLDSVLTGMGFKCIESDRSVYIYSNDEVKIFVPIYIDDITFASKSGASIEKYIQILSTHFKCRDLGPTHFLLGIAINRNRSTRTITLHQRQFAIDLLEKYGMSDCSPVHSPLPPKVELSHSMAPSTQEEEDFMSKVPYLSAVGSLQYLAMMTRPDIAHAVAYLARFNQNPGLQHWKALKHLMRYVKGTLEHKLTYSGDKCSSLAFVTYSDSSHGDCVDSGRSTAGYVTMVAGGAIGWYSKLQTIVALSTPEAEYIAAVEAGKEIMWMRNLLSEFGYAVQGPSILKMDNQGAICVSKNPEHHGRMKHLDLRTYWLRNAVNNQVIAPEYIPTGEMVADNLTKSVPVPKVKYCREQMGVLP